MQYAMGKYLQRFVLKTTILHTKVEEIYKYPGKYTRQIIGLELQGKLLTMPRYIFSFKNNPWDDISDTYHRIFGGFAYKYIFKGDNYWLLYYESQRK